jgi:hypothetical protein
MGSKAIGISSIGLGLAVVSALAYWAKTPLPEFLFQIGLTTVGIILALAYADLGKPILHLEPLDTSNIYIGDELVLWLYLKISNRPRKRLPFLARATAFSCHGTITFMDMDRTKRFDMNIRWSSNPQPVQAVVVSDQLRLIPDMNFIRATQFIDIPADESEPLDVCCRNPAETNANAWNSENYQFAKNRHPKRHIPTGDYLIDVVVKHSDGSASSMFRLHNPEDPKGFKLEPYFDASESTGE